MKSSKAKPIYSWLLVLTLMVAMLPISSFAQSTPVAAAAKPGDGTVKRVVVMLHGEAQQPYWEQIHWDDVTFMYNTLRDDYNIPAAQIFLLNYRGTNPQGQNPDQMIDDVASMASLNATFATLQTMVDGDDELLVWVTGRGLGYHIEARDRYKLTGRASVQPGDEQDMLERDLLLRTFSVKFDTFLFTSGMDRYHGWREELHTVYAFRAYRQKYVSSFDNVQFELIGVRSDHDIYIETIVDYLLGDTNRDGMIEPYSGERFDYDQDGVPPMDANGLNFDEDDWGNPELYYDDIHDLDTRIPGDDNYVLFDQGFDNHLDIDLNYTGGALKVDGTDTPNTGYFVGLDVNEDGDMDDWVSIDEGVQLPDDILWDDDLAALVAKVSPKVTTIFLAPSFSGGFIDDLSAPNRIIAASIAEDTEPHNFYYTFLFTAALHGTTAQGFPADADSDHNGCVSMLEAFNFAATQYYTDDVAQYDDNGDKIGNAPRVPRGGDGKLGVKTYLEKCPPSFARISFNKDAQPDSMQDFTFYTPFGKVLLDDAVPNDGDSVQKSITFNVEALATYNFTEATFPSWSLAAINCTPAERATVDLVNRKLTLNVLANDDITCTWVNQRRINLQATKFNDRDGDGAYALDEPTLAGWEMVLYTTQNQRLLGKVTGTDGSTLFNNRTPGAYKLCETPKAGWTNTMPGETEPVINKPCYELTLLPGQNGSLLFGNTQGVVKPAEEVDPSVGITIGDLPDINEPVSEEETNEEGELKVEVYLPVVNR